MTEQVHPLDLLLSTLLQAANPTEESAQSKQLRAMLQQGLAANHNDQAVNEERLRVIHSNLDNMEAEVISIRDAQELLTLGEEVIEDLLKDPEINPNDFAEAIFALKFAFGV